MPGRSAVGVSVGSYPQKETGFARSRMRKPPFPRAVPHRPPREHWATVGACGVLALGHATRVAVDSHHVAYLSILDLLGLAAALGVGIQIALVDDGISRVLAAGVAALLGAASIVSVTIGFPGAAPDGFGLVPLFTLAASAYVLGASIVGHVARRRTERDHASARHPSAPTRRAHLRTRRLAHRVVRAPRGTAPARGARRGPARPAA